LLYAIAEFEDAKEWFCDFVPAKIITREFRMPKKIEKPPCFAGVSSGS